ncbi:DC-STAMP domain-containing protein 2-like [Periplaneta americana]|uniref:DC-STAMP domain-containing protein 2-like n=1 Tax=Periplaneta americana TaxID=6978 RepID=UPI0037E7F851
MKCTSPLAACDLSPAHPMGAPYLPHPKFIPPRCRRNTRYFLRRICMLSPDNRLQQFCTKLRMDGSFENYIAKSILGFFGGILLTYVFFMFFIIQLNFSLTGATLWCMFFGLILTLGLAFSHVVRVIVFLLLPQFFSKRGRQALMAFAFVLALTGPAKNTLRNTEIMFESLACGQEQLKVAVRQIIEAIKKPFMAIKDAFRKVMKIIKLIVKKIKDILLAIKRIIVSILRVIKSVIQWLGNIVNICNKKVGTPFQRCMRVFDGAVTDCQAKLGPLFNWMCSLTYVVSIVCYVVKIFDLICMLLDFINNNVIGVVKKKVKSFVDHIRNIFYVSVDFKHSFHFETQQSISMREIAASLVAEIRQRTEKFLTIFDWMGFAFSLLFLTMIFKVIQYRLKFMKNDRFDNRFITKDFRDIDLQRAKNDLETVIPLNRREKSQYIIAKSFRLAKAEKVQLAKSAVFLGITTFKLCIHMLTDYCLYWLLSLIRQHGSVQTTVEAPNTVGVHIEGEGLMADLLRSVAKAFKPLGIKMEVDTVPCLPDPIPPDYGRYIQIVAVMLLCWLLALLEPYGLRMRHVVMCYYYPDRARQRAVWLYNHILRSRGGFLKFARRQLRRKFGKDKEGAIEKVSLLDRLRERFPFLNIILGKSSQKSCLLCGRVVKKGSKQQLIICPTPNCIGQYCVACFADLKNICPICKKPIEYGDLSDISIER